MHRQTDRQTDIISVYINDLEPTHSGKYMRERGERGRGRKEEEERRKCRREKQREGG